MLLTLYASIRKAGFRDEAEQRAMLTRLQPYIEQKGKSDQYVAMDILFCMTIPEAAEVARLHLDDYFFGEPCGFYLARIGDPDGWPTVRAFLEEGMDNQNEYGEMDVYAGLKGLAGTRDIKTKKQVLKALLAELGTELDRYGPSSRRALGSGPNKRIPRSTLL